MSKVLLLSASFVLSLLLSGCATGLKTAISAYGTVAEQHAAVMKVAFDRCLSEKDASTKSAACGAVSDSIEAYRKSAADLASLSTSKTGEK